MINDAVDYIRREVRDHLGVANTDVVIDGVLALKEGTGAHILLVNLEEESALRNTERVVRQGNAAHYTEPPVHLNLYLLFAFAFQDYGTTLLRLSETIELFQNKRFFGADNETAANPFPASLEKLVFDLHNTSFEQLNHLWGVLGGTYFPSVLYKVRLVKVQRDHSVSADEVRTIVVDTGVA